MIRTDIALTLRTHGIPASLKVRTVEFADLARDTAIFADVTSADPVPDTVRAELDVVRAQYPGTRIIIRWNGDRI